MFKRFTLLLLLSTAPAFAQDATAPAPATPPGQIQRSNEAIRRDERRLGELKREGREDQRDVNQDKRQLRTDERDNASAGQIKGDEKKLERDRIARDRADERVREKREQIQEKREERREERHERAERHRK